MSNCAGIAPGLGRHLAEARDQLGQRRRRSGGDLRHPAVAVADRAARAVGERAADQDRRMRLLHRLRPGLHRIEVDELAVVFGRVLRPDRLHRLDALARQLVRAWRRRCRGSPSRPGSSRCRHRTRSARRRPGRSRPPASPSGSDRAARSGRRRCRSSASSSPPPPRSASRTDPSRRSSASADRRPGRTASCATSGMCECSGAQTMSKPRCLQRRGEFRRGHRVVGEEHRGAEFHGPRVLCCMFHHAHPPHGALPDIDIVGAREMPARRPSAMRNSDNCAAR